MSLEIRDDYVGVAVARHPEESIIALDPVIYKKNHLVAHANLEGEHSYCISGLNPKDRVAQEVRAMIREYDVAAFVVGWPLQDDGRIGTSCGKVMHLLNYFAATHHFQPKGVHEHDALFSNRRPVSLWIEGDAPQRICKNFGEQVIPGANPVQTDRWGRSPSYSRHSAPPELTYSSTYGTSTTKVKRQRQLSYEDCSVEAASILKCFFDTHNLLPKEEEEPAMKQHETKHLVSSRKLTRTLMTA